MPRAGGCSRAKRIRPFFSEFWAGTGAEIALLAGGKGLELGRYASAALELDVPTQIMHNQLRQSGCGARAWLKPAVWAEFGRSLGGAETGSRRAWGAITARFVGSRPRMRTRASAAKEPCSSKPGCLPAIGAPGSIDWERLGGCVWWGRRGHKSDRTQQSPTLGRRQIRSSRPTNQGAPTARHWQ